jgi:hypothetical protein
MFRHLKTYQILICKVNKNACKHTNKTPWPEPASELYRPSDHCLSAVLVPPLVDKGSTRMLSSLITLLQLGYLEVTVQERLRSGWSGPFVKIEGCCD